MKSKLVVLSVSTFCCFSAFAKITVYSTQAVLAKVLSSPQLVREYGPGRRLSGHWLQEVKASREQATTSSPAMYRFKLSYKEFFGTTTCELTASVPLEIVTSGGITSSKLGPTSLSTIGCAVE